MKHLLIPIAVLAILLAGASPAAAVSTQPSVGRITRMAITGAECAREQAIAHTQAACVETISTHRALYVPVGLTADSTWKVAYSWLDITGPFDLWQVLAVSHYRYDGTHVYELYQDCTDHAAFGVGLDIVSCSAVNNGGAYLGYMLPGVVWKVSLGPFSTQDVARWRVYANGAYCCAYGTHG